MPKPTPETQPQTLETRLDEIILHLKRMDARDKLRTWGSLFRVLFAIIPLLVFLGSLWYIALNGEKLMKEIAGVAASAAADYTQNQSKGLYDQIMNKYQTPKQ